MVTYCELMNNPQRIDMDSKSCEFDIIIGNIRQILIEKYVAVENYQNDFQWSIKQRNEYLQKSQEISVMPRMPEIENYQLMYDDQANQIWLQINQQCSDILTPIQGIISTLKEAQKFLIEDRLSKWKCDQILVGYGDLNVKKSKWGDKNPQLKITLNEIQKQFEDLKITLNEIQKQYEDLFECVWITQILLNTIRDCHSELNYVDSLEVKLSCDITIIQRALIKSSFIVEEQPSQVIHIDVRFQATVRLLLSKFITITGVDKPCVTVSILSGWQVQQQQPKFLPLNQESGEISIKMNTGFHLLQPQRLICELKQMKLTDITRSEKGANESVMDEKFALLFECKLHIKNKPFHIWAVSLPITVAKHGNQDPEGWATITWDNSFFEINRIPFAVRGEVPWSHMEWALSTRFYYQTGCNLTGDHLQHLYEKIFGPSPKQDRLISWSQFCKNPLAGQSFSFFEWFYMATKLTRLHLSEQWKNGLIEGFISKNHARDKLLLCKPGTFLLRLSDSQLGGISAASVERNAQGSLKVEHMDPFLINDFGITEPFLTIGDFIKRNLDECIYVYPEILKDKAFSRYYTPDKKCSIGYDKAKKLLCLGRISGTKLICHKTYFMVHREVNL